MDEWKRDVVEGGRGVVQAMEELVETLREVFEG